METVHQYSDAEAALSQVSKSSQLDQLGLAAPDLLFVVCWENSGILRLIEFEWIEFNFILTFNKEIAFFEISLHFRARLPVNISPGQEELN